MSVCGGPIGGERLRPARRAGARAVCGGCALPAISWARNGASRERAGAARCAAGGASAISARPGAPASLARLRGVCPAAVDPIRTRSVRCRRDASRCLSQFGTTRPGSDVPSASQAPCRHGKAGNLSNYLRIVRNLASLAWRRPTPAAPLAFQKGASVTRSDKPAVPDAAEILRARSAMPPMNGGSTPTRSPGATMPPPCSALPIRRRSRAAALLRLASKPRPGRAAPTRCRRAASADPRRRALPIKCNTRFKRGRRERSGWRTPAAGSPAPTASRSARIGIIRAIDARHRARAPARRSSPNSIRSPAR